MGKKAHYLLPVIRLKVALCCFVQEINSGGKHRGAHWIKSGMCLCCTVV